MLQITGLTKIFGGIRAVDGCSFSIAPGRITALIGPNGAGKTTLFNCVAGVMPADSGTVHFVGRDITRLPIYARARLGISRTFQLVRTFANLTVEENLHLAAEPRDQDFWRTLFLPHTVATQFPPLRSDVSVGLRTAASEVRGGEEGLRAVHNSPQPPLTLRGGARMMLEDVMNLVGLDQPLNYPAKSLSYGQSKLLSLARALLMPHKILLLDEPVAGVAPHLRDQFKKLLPDLKARGETIFFIEHDMDFVRAVADHVIVMDQGRVLTQGTPEQVLQDKRVLEAYLGEQL